jgi:lysophospholipid acyltransferase (LPLAT)-like uncharacterized protein
MSITTQSPEKGQGSRTWTLREMRHFRFISGLIYYAARLLGRSLRLRVVGEKSVTDLQRDGHGLILATWHGRSLVPLPRFGGRGYWAMISTSRDGEYQDRIFRRFGWNTVRGSTSARGAVRAVLTLIRHLRTGATLALTPDGPRGPSGAVHAGTVVLAQKSGCPVIPAGASATPRWLLRTWDHYLIPYPFARAALVYGTPIYIPCDEDTPEQQRQWADRIGAAIDAAQAEADCILTARAASQMRPATAPVRQRPDGPDQA